MEMASDWLEVLWRRANLRRCKRQRLSGTLISRGAIALVPWGKGISHLLTVNRVALARCRYGLNTCNIGKQFEFNVRGPAQYAYRSQENCAVSGLQMIVPVFLRVPLLDQHRGIIVGRVQIKTRAKTTLFVHYRR